MNLNEALGIVQQLKFKDWKFHIGDDRGRPWLQLQFMAPCNHGGGEPFLQKCRKWFLSPHMTRTEIVRTAYKAVQTAMEHEVAEQFLYKDRPIFDPHTNVDNLHEACIELDVRASQANQVKAAG